MNFQNNQEYMSGNMSSESSNLFSNKNILIIILVLIILLSLLGINILLLIGEYMQKIIDIFKPFTQKILSIFGYTTGTVLNTTADVVADTAKLGIDIAEGSVQSVGNLLKNSGQSVDNATKSHIDATVSTSKLSLPNMPLPNDSSHPIQTGTSSSNNKWCLVGEYQQKRGCIEITDVDKCLSGQVFPNQKMCLNPTMTPNV